MLVRVLLPLLLGLGALFTLVPSGWRLLRAAARDFWNVVVLHNRDAGGRFRLTLYDEIGAHATALVFTLVAIAILVVALLIVVNLVGSGRL
jgi:hypothetical protein